MQISKAKVIALYKNKIVYKNNKKIQRKHFVLSIFSFCFCTLAVFCVAFSGLKISNTIKQVSILYKDPASPLYSDMSDIVFTSSNLVSTYYAGANVVFELPITSSQVSLHDDQIDIVVEDVLRVAAVGDGIVTKIGKNEQGKYVVISHDEGLSSVVSNLSIVGVVIGDNVKAGQSIGVATQGSVINLMILYNNQKIQLSLDGGKIKWTH